MPMSAFFEQKRVPWQLGRPGSHRSRDGVLPGLTVNLFARRGLGTLRCCQGDPACSWSSVRPRRALEARDWRPRCGKLEARGEAMRLLSPHQEAETKSSPCTSELASFAPLPFILAELTSLFIIDSCVPVASVSTVLLKIPHQYPASCPTLPMDVIV